MIQRMPVGVDVVKAYDACVNQNFGDALRSGREDAGLTQRALAESLRDRGVNLDQAAIARMEKGEREPKLTEAQVIADVLGFSLESIGASDNPTVVRLRSLVEKLRQHRAREVAEGIRRETVLASIVEMLRSSPDLEYELTDRDRKTLHHHYLLRDELDPRHFEYEQNFE